MRFLRLSVVGYKVLSLNTCNSIIQFKFAFGSNKYIYLFNSFVVRCAYNYQYHQHLHTIPVRPIHLLMIDDCIKANCNQQQDLYNLLYFGLTINFESSYYYNCVMLYKFKQQHFGKNSNRIFYTKYPKSMMKLVLHIKYIYQYINMCILILVKNNTDYIATIEKYILLQKNNIDSF